MNNEDKINDEFVGQLKSLEKIYAESSLKEKHKINEHIKFILKSHGDKSTENIERDLK
jgi:hypothetical protein